MRGETLKKRLSFGSNFPDISNLGAYDSPGSAGRAQSVKG